MHIYADIVNNILNSEMFNYLLYGLLLKRKNAQNSNHGARTDKICDNQNNSS